MSRSPHHITPSQTSTVLHESTMRPSDQSCYTDPTIPKLFVSDPMFAHTFWLNECDDCMLRSPSLQLVGLDTVMLSSSLDPTKPSALSPNFILSASLEVKLELEIHLVSSVFQRRFDYQLFLRTIAMGTKVELPFGFLHFAEHDSPRNAPPSWNIVKNIYSPPASSVYFTVVLTAAAIHPTGIITTTPLTATSSHAPLDATTSLASFTVSFIPLLVAIYIVQECGLARFTRHYVTVAFPTHYAVSSIDGSSQSWLYDPLSPFLFAGTNVQECGRARFSRYYVTAAPLSHYAVSNIDGSSQSQLCDLQIRAVTQTQPSQSFLSPSATTCWARHGNVEFRGLDPTKPSALSPNFILSASLEVKLELEIHLVSSVSLVGFKADYACFNAKSSHYRTPYSVLSIVLELLT
ncbi:hypothetical protein Bca52824_063930 [Brassica carinata]|uniref:Uncharacterized protein n=1 Tax=Brassica carinata TaxID=52824 RepID=A0A8X7QFM9_BRACI|nr:hypothetical protein Bca52824_063930 [Brassica carinata]